MKVLSIKFYSFIVLIFKAFYCECFLALPTNWN